MAHEPSKVTLLNSRGAAIFSVTSSHPESLDSRHSQDTRSITIEGPVNCVVTCFDDQQFRMGQNSVQITKTVPGPITVPIATNFVSGQQRNGVFVGTAAGYKWQFNKAIHRSSWDDILTLGWQLVQSYLKREPELEAIVTAAGVPGWVYKQDGTTSSNNHVDNLSSIRFGQ